MSLNASTSIQPVVLTIQGMLQKVDRLQLPPMSRRDVEHILVKKVTTVLDAALPWQHGHGRRTAEIAVAIGNLAGLSVDALHTLRLASLLHDVGLLMLPSGLLSKPGPLDSNEYMAVQCHSRAGAELLAPYHFLQDSAVLIAHHHERWDGTGYPYGLRGTFIPLSARILSIADVFDAIDVPGVHDRRIRSNIAYRILCVSAGTQFDENLVKLLGQSVHSRNTSSIRHDNS